MSWMPGVELTKRQLERARSQIRIATARGITKTLQEIRSTTVQEMRRVFNAPTRYVLNAFYMRAAERDRLTGEVWLKPDPQYRQHPIEVQIRGGPSRPQKRFEKALQALGAMQQGWYAVPAPLALDGSGKVRKGLVQQILGQARFQRTSGTADKRAKGRQKAAQTRAGGQFVFVPQRRGKLSPGIYLAESLKRGPRGNRLRPVFRFVPRVTYAMRLDFFGIGQRIADQRLAANIESSLQGLNLLR